MIQINPTIIKELEEGKIYTPNGVMYLLSVYFELDETITPEIIKTQVNALKLFERNYNTGSITWNITMFKDIKNVFNQSLVDNWEWVETYRQKFKDVRKDAAGDKRGCMSKMQKFFAQYPEVRSTDILEAAQLYIRPFADGTEDPKYMQRADYFISKQVKIKNETTIQSRLLQYLEMVFDGKNAGINRQLKKVKRR